MASFEDRFCFQEGLSSSFQNYTNEFFPHRRDTKLAWFDPALRGTHHDRVKPFALSLWFDKLTTFVRSS